MPLALLSISVCFLLSLSVAVLYSFQAILLTFLISWSQRTLFTVGETMFQPYAWEGGDWAPPGYFQFSKDVLRLERGQELPSALAMN